MINGYLNLVSFLDYENGSYSCISASKYLIRVLFCMLLNTMSFHNSQAITKKTKEGEISHPTSNLPDLFFGLYVLLK